MEPTDKNAKPVKPKALSDSTTLQDAGLDASTNTIYVKDLGTQVSYRTVFIVEYVSRIDLSPVRCFDTLLDWPVAHPSGCVPLAQTHIRKRRGA